MKQSKFGHLQKRVPESSWLPLLRLLEGYEGSVYVSRPRKTKLGDFRTKQNSNSAVITVNSDLNQFSFLITLLHELAHYVTWKEHKHAVLPHGKEWKRNFSELISPFVAADVFPGTVKSALQYHLNSPKASSCTDANLYKALDEFNPDDELDFVADLPLGSRFSFRNRGVFEVKEHLRKRIKCGHQQSGRMYLFQPITKVKLLQT